MTAQTADDVDHTLGTATSAAANAGMDEEQNMSIQEALKHHRPAAFWSFMMSLSNIMEGFNLSLGSSMILFPPFEEKYGTYEPGLGFIVNAKWMTAIGLAATVGGIIGVLLGGSLIERIGVRYTMMLSQIVISGAIFIQFYAPTMPVLFAGTLVNGIPWGMLSSVGSIYASEICPTALRGYLINVSNISFGFGGLLATVVLQIKSSDPTQWAYRLPFALQWMWPAPLFLIAALAPDSPWWLIRRGKMDKVRAALRRLTRDRSDGQIDDQIVLMLRTNEYEKQAETESGYRDIFRGTNLRRTEIACFALSVQGLTGSNLASNPTYFMDQVGLGSQNSFRVGCVAAAVSLLANFVCWIFMARFGRRSLFIFGLVGMAILLLFIGLLDLDPSPTAVWAQAGLCIAWVLVYGIFVAPESYTIAGEISATRVRAETLSFAKSVFGVTACASAVLQTNIVNPTGADLKAKSAYVWLGFTVLYVIWAFLRLPETRGKTYQELDILFESRVSARQFAAHDNALVDEINQCVHVAGFKSDDHAREMLNEHSEPVGPNGTISRP